MVYAAVVGVITFAGAGYEWVVTFDTHYIKTVPVFYDRFVPKRYSSWTANNTWKCEQSVIRVNDGLS